MSKLGELICEFCSNGVETVKIKNAFQRLKGTPITAARMKEINNPEGEIKVFAGGKTVITAKEKDIPNANIIRVPAVLVQSRGVIDVVYYDKPFTFKNEMWAYTTSDSTTVKYLFYVLKNNVQRFRDAASGMGSLPQISLPVTEEFEIPFPPIEVQHEIVRILDNFTNLTAELTAELTARKTQYSFYREKLLDKTEMKALMVEIADLGKWSGGKTPSMAEKKYWESGTIPWVSSKDVKQPILSDTIDHITNAAIDEASMTVYPAGSVAIVTRSGILRHTFPVTYIPFETTVNQDIKILVTKEGISSRYVSHALQAYGESIRRTTKKQGGTVDSLDFQKVLAYKIPVPPIDVQDRIVNVLDNFEKICSDLNIGLPAEIEARQKQYEYYRDKLLTFAENGNTILSRAEQSRAEQSRAEQSRALIKLLQYVFGYAVVSLQDVVKNSCSGGTPKKGVSEYYEDGNIPWLRTQEVVFRDICKTECFITESAVKNSAAKWIPENCVIVAISGATAGRCAINKIPLTTNQHCLNLEVDPEMALYRYVYYCICAKQEELLAKKEGARGDLNSTRILSLQIDLPSIEEQKRIISILDRFDAICNDLTSGLPAEIEARQKQYEYYRDKLLTFKEVAAT